MMALADCGLVGLSPLLPPHGSQFTLKCSTEASRGPLAPPPSVQTEKE